jgi:hypothetical protein
MARKKDLEDYTVDDIDELESALYSLIDANERLERLDMHDLDDEIQQVRYRLDELNEEAWDAEHRERASLSYLFGA